MISKRKRNTILVYCMASVVMLCALVSNVSKVTTNMKTNNKKVVADNHSVDTTELSYGLLALEASSALEENKDAQNVTEKKEEKKELSDNKTEDKEDSTKKDEKSNKTTTKKKTSNKTTSNKTTTKKVTSNKTTTKKTTSNKTTTKTTTTSNKTTSTKKTTSNVTSNKTSNSTSTKTNSAKGVQIANYAKQFVGKSYRMGGQWNGEMPYTATDCSGFTQGVYKHFGYNIPRVARDQAKIGKKVNWNDLQPGDLIFYSGNGGKSVTHVAMYIGNGKIVHAQTPSLGIGITTYKIMIRMTARRVI